MLWGVELLEVEMGKTVENSQFRRLKDNDKKRLQDYSTWFLPKRTTPATDFMFHSRKLHFNLCYTGKNMFTETHMPGYYKLNHIQYCWHEHQCKCLWGVLTFSHQRHQDCALFTPFEFILLLTLNWESKHDEELQTLNGSRIKRLVLPKMKTVIICLKPFKPITLSFILGILIKMFLIFSIISIHWKFMQTKFLSSKKFKKTLWI